MPDDEAIDLMDIYATDGYGFEHGCKIFNRFGFSNLNLFKIIGYSVKKKRPSNE